MEVYQKTSTLLKVEGLNKSYGSKVVLRDIHLEVKDIVVPGRIQGQVVSLIGRSGVGKSTLFRILSGLEKPTSGQVWVNGDTPESLKPVKEGDMGVVFQNYLIYDDLTVKQNFQLSLKFRPDRASIDEKAYLDGYASEFGLTEHLNKYPCQLSGGQRQRAAIIMQLLNGSNFLLLDEPFSGLDCLMIDKVTALLTKVANTHELQTLIIVSHDLENSLAISDTAFVLALEEGKEGAVVKAEIDLIERDLAWHPGIKENPIFRETLKEVKSLL
jgi:ABC-type nitrate/sulfonate/bicarbonate transport system ATPase subunit